MHIAVSGLRKLSLTVIFLTTCIVCSKQALASGDYGCSPQWRLVHHDYEGCSSMAVLAPSNDTRVNLLLLIADLRAAHAGVNGKAAASAPESPLFAWEALADKFRTQEEKTASKNAETADQSSSRPCAAATPASDPFVAALQADPALQPEERDVLLAARKAMAGCSGDAGAGAIAAAEKTVKAASGKAFASYLDGASAFWRNDYDKADAAFTGLANSQTVWVKEAATYMIGRVLINRAQTGAFDEYGSFKKDWQADAKIIDKAEAALDTYLRSYPKGVYAKSARGLKRRGYWLARDNEKLCEEYDALLEMSEKDRNISDVELAQEIDNKLAESPYSDGNLEKALAGNGSLKSTRSPLLLAMFDLAEMRMAEKADENRNSYAPISLDELRAQKPYFTGQMPLYEYLLAVHAFYIENKPAEVLHIISAAARQSSFSYLQFSRQALRGMALESLKDRNALGFWTQMLQGAKAPYERGALELAIAHHEERAGEVRDVFTTASPVHYPYLREVLLAKIADAELLRTQAKNTTAPPHEREIALFTLLYKESTRGYAADFLKDLALVPANAPTDGAFVLDGGDTEYVMADNYQPSPIPLGIFLHDKTDAHFGCGALRTSEAQLVRDADNPTARLCVADFVRINQPFFYSGEMLPSTDELGDTKSLFPGSEFVRMDTYTAVLANAKSSHNDKAYALFRAVNCYAPSGNNDCGGKDVPKAQRKAWFLTLKHDYADTRWANDLEYYW
jgi:hypothetical protein